MRYYAIILFGFMACLGIAYLPRFIRAMKYDLLDEIDGFIVGCLILGVVFFGVSLSIGLI